MPNPRNASGYSQVWWNLVDVFKKKPDGFTINFEDGNDAQKFRFTFYAFREAVKRGSQNKKDDMGEECMEAYPVLMNIKMLIKASDDGTTNLLIRPARKIIDTQEQAVNGQLMGLMEQIADREVEMATFDTSDIKDKEASSLDILGIMRNK